LAFVISAGAAAPGGYVIPTGHTVAAVGNQELFFRVRRYLTGNPEIATNVVVGTHTNVLEQIDTHKNLALTTGTYSLRHNGGDVFTLSHSTAGVLDAAIAAAAGVSTDYNFNGQQTHGVAFRINRTNNSDPPLATTEGWDFTLAANGLPTNDRWFAEFEASTTNLAKTAVNLRGRRVSGSSDPTDYFYVRFNIDNTSGTLVLRGFENAAGTGNVSTLVYMSVGTGSSISYLLVASHRHFCLVGRVSGDYHQMWGGFIDVFATKQQYPYPLMVAGDTTTFNTAPNSTVEDHMAPWMNGAGSSFFRSPEGVWKEVFGRGVQSGTGFASGDLQTSSPSANDSCFWPWASPGQTVQGVIYGAQGRGVGTNIYLGGALFITPMRGAPSTERYALPCMVIQGETNRHPIMGEVASVFCTNGLAQPGVPLEEIFTVGSDPYIMFPNISRQQEQNFWSLKLV